jgi:hypothetical protein
MNKKNRGLVNTIFREDLYKFLCKLIGSQPYLAANVRSLPAAEFYRWVEYCNSPAGVSSGSAYRAARELEAMGREGYIADEHQRNQVYELNEIAALEGLTMKWESRVRLDVVRQNLMRMWAST